MGYYLWTCLYNTYIIDKFDYIKGICIALPFKLEEYLNGVFSIPQQGSFWKRNVFEKVGGFNEENYTSMDGEFYVRAASKGFTFLNVDMPLACFRIHKDSITGSRRLQVQYLLDQKKLQQEFSDVVEVSKFKSFVFRIKYLPYKFLKRFKLLF